MSLTTDPTNTCLKEYSKDGQQECYLILSEEERKKGFVRPVRTVYKHLTCNQKTSMGRLIAESYARDFTFYGGTYCSYCMSHFNLVNSEGKRQFAWVGEDGRLDGTYVGE